MAIGGYKKLTQPDNSGNQLFRNVLTGAGMAVGGFFGGPGGAAAGGSIGTAVGGMVAPDKQAEMSEGKMMAPTAGGDGGAISRRLESLNQSNATGDILAAGQALKKYPELEQEYKPALVSTYQALRGGRQV